MTRPNEEPGDDVFRADALALGYLETDVHEPGNGRGLRAYYSDHGMIQPEVLRKELPRKELTTLLAFERTDNPLLAVAQDGRTPEPVIGRHTRGQAAEL